MRNMINLLPASYRRQQLVRIRSIQWATVLCVVILTGWSWTLLEEHQSRAMAHQMESLEREHAPIKHMLKQLVDMRQKLKGLQLQEAVAAELEHHRNALMILSVISRAAQETNGRVRVTRLELTGFQDFDSPADAPQKDLPHGLIVRGVSLDNAAVVEMLDGLQDSDVFSRVELTESKERPGGELTLRDYEVKCEF